MTTGGSSGNESSPDALDTFNLKRIDLPRQRRVRKQGGKRSASQTPDRRGRYVILLGCRSEGSGQFAPTG